MILSKHYLDPFFVGLFEGDGSLYMAQTKKPKNQRQGTYSYPVAQIKLNKHPENEALLRHVVSLYGGNITFEKANPNHKVVWVASSQKAMARIFNCFKAYPLLSSKKVFQLRHVQACAQNRSWGYHLKHRENKYSGQLAFVKHFNQSFSKPAYFKAWLSGFYEAKGSFNATHAFRVLISQDHDWYLINAIKQYFQSHHKIGLHKDKRYTAPSVHYRLSITGKPVLKNVLAHFETFPLLGLKATGYNEFAQKCAEQYKF